MWSLFQRKTDVSDDILARIKKLEAQVLELYADNEIMRNNVLRKLQTRLSKKTDLQEDIPRKSGIISAEQAAGLK